MLFFSYFKSLVGKEVTVELKNDLAITGKLHSVDQYLNIKLTDTKAVNAAKYPHMVRRLHCWVMRLGILNNSLCYDEHADVRAELLHPWKRSALRPGNASPGSAFKAISDHQLVGFETVAFCLPYSYQQTPWMWRFCTMPHEERRGAGSF